MTETLDRVPRWIHKTLVPLFLLVLCPPAVFVFWYVNTALNGSFMEFWRILATQGIVNTLIRIWSPVFFGSAIAWKIIGCFGALQLLLMRIVPGKLFSGPITPKGNIPLYKANGFACFLLTQSLFCLGAFYFHWFDAALIYDHFGEILGALNVFSLLFCLFLYVKGILLPSSSDCGRSGYFLFDYYWGTELYPRIAGWDVKQFTNCRFGMMGWGLILLSFAAKQASLYGLSNSMCVSVGLQLLYIAKFFIWEPGYLRSLDIMHDRAGFMICWGCLVWVPAIYTSTTLYLVNHPIHLMREIAAAIFLLGFSSIAINYLADRQRQLVRATMGSCLVWRKTPVLIEAIYTTHAQETKKNLLLASGWWGLSRHFHYLPEIAAAFFWSVPALFTHFSPYFYVVFLSILLIDRAYRHDKRCSDKYGSAWENYCQAVPYKIIPYIF